MAIPRPFSSFACKWELPPGSQGLHCHTRPISPRAWPCRDGTWGTSAPSAAPCFPLVLFAGPASLLPPLQVKAGKSLTSQLLPNRTQRSRHAAGTLMVSRLGFWTATLQGKEKSGKEAEERGGELGGLLQFRADPRGHLRGEPAVIFPLWGSAVPEPAPAGKRRGTRSKNSVRSRCRAGAAGAGGRDARRSGGCCASAHRS